jgi:hypothetical protein
MMEISAAIGGAMLGQSLKEDNVGPLYESSKTVPSSNPWTLIQGNRWSSVIYGKMRRKAVERALCEEKAFLIRPLCGLQLAVNLKLKIDEVLVRRVGIAGGEARFLSPTAPKYP